MALERRPLGATGLSVSSLGMGCAKLGAFWQGRSAAAGSRALAEARAGGIDFFDTADCYARGISERVIGRAFRRDGEVVIATKVGLLKTPLALASAYRRSRRAAGERAALLREPLRQARGMAPRGPAAQCFEPDYVERALERCLKRLARGHVELLLLHGPPLEVIERAEFLPAIERLRREGKIRHFGLSCAGPAEARAGLGVPGVECLQLFHNVTRPDSVTEVAADAKRLGVGLVAAAPLGDGTLPAAASGAGLDRRQAVAALLRFSLETPGVSSTLAGMSKAEHVRENLRAAELELPADALERLRSALSEPRAPGRC